MPAHSERHRLTLAQLTLTFVPFGLLLAAALLAPEVLVPGGVSPLPWLEDLVGLNEPQLRPVPAGTSLLALNRAILTIWLTTALLIPAACLYVLPPEPARRTYALLFWTFSYLAYLAHFYYAAFVIFGGVAGTFEHMRHPIAAMNFLLTAWWTMDVLLAWVASPDRPWVRLERTAALVFILLVFVITELFLRPTVVRYLGIALVVSVLLCLLVRLAWGGEAARPAEQRLV
jgi:hypothetical protein